jgi:hypothetical protein
VGDAAYQWIALVAIMLSPVIYALGFWRGGRFVLARLKEADRGSTSDP